MGVFSTPIDTATIEAPQSSYEPLAPGKYDAIIASAESKVTKKGDGQYLEIKFEITSPHGQGRFVWARLNLDNPNPVAQEIAQRELKLIGNAIGVTRFESEDQLLDKGISIKVAVKEERNEVKGYYKLGTQSPAAVAQPAAATPSQPAAAATEQSNIPW